MLLPESHLSYEHGKKSAKAYLKCHTMQQALTAIECFTTDTPFDRGFRDLIEEVRKIVYEEE